MVSLFIQPKKPIFLRFVIICFFFLWLALNTIWLWLVVAFIRGLDGSDACGLHSHFLITPWGLVGAFSCECKEQYFVLSWGSVCVCVRVCLCVHVIVAGVGK